MGNQQNDGKRDDAWWLDQWKQSDAVLRRQQQARERAWPGYVKEQTERARYSAWLVLPTMAAMFLGYRLQDRLDQRAFRGLTLAMLILAGLNLLRRAFFA